MQRFERRSFEGPESVLALAGLALLTHAAAAAPAEFTARAPDPVTIHSATKTRTEGYDARTFFDRSEWFVDPLPLFTSKAVLSAARPEERILELRLDDAARERLLATGSKQLAILVGNELRFIVDTSSRPDGFVAFHTRMPATQAGTLAALLGYPFLLADGPVLEVISRTPHSQPGSEVIVDVYLGNAGSLGAYQVSLEAVRGRRGVLTPIRLMVDEQRGDFVFHGRPSHTGADLENWRVWGDVDGEAVDATKPGYVGTFVYRATGDALGTFTIRVRSDSGSYIRTAEGIEVEFRAGAATFQIAKNSTPFFRR